jgi:hypothetical protein
MNSWQRIVLACALIALAFATSAPRAEQKNWNAGDGNWSEGANWTPAGVPAADDDVRIEFTDGVARTVMYDYLGPPLMLSRLSVDLTGPGTDMATLSMEGNSLAADDVLIGDSGRGAMNQGGGSFDATTFIVGDEATAVGEYSLSGGLLTTAAAFISNGATGSEGSNGGTFIHSGGIHQNTGLHIGAQAGSKGQYVLGSTGALFASTEFVGTNGSGTFSHNGGANSVDTALAIGALVGSDGLYSMNNGVLTAADIHIGGYTLNGPGGHGELHISGNNSSVNVAGTIKIYDSPDSRLVLNSGTLTAGTIDVGGIPSRFSWFGGTLHVSNDVTWSNGEPINSTGAIFGSSLNLGSSKSLRVTGNETIGGTGVFSLSISNNQVHSVTGTINLKAGGTLQGNSSANLTYATFVQDGGTISSFFRNTGHYIYRSGSISAQFINSGTMALEANMAISGNLTNETTITVPNGRTLSATSTFTNNGTLILDGGMATTSSQLTNPAGATIRGRGTLGFSGTFMNRGTFDLTGTLTLSGSPNFINEGVIQGIGALSTMFGQISNSGSGVINSTVNGGTLTIGNLQSNQGVMNVGPNSTLSFTTQWSNTGLVNLQGADARLTGGNLGSNSTGIIQGAGTVTTALGLYAGTIRATGGVLYFTAPNISLGAQSQIQVLEGSTISFLQGHISNPGIISLDGGTFDNNNKSLQNGGTINGHGTIFTGQTGLTNMPTRLISVGGGDMDIFGRVTNNGIVNIQTGNSAYFFNNVTGSGTFTGGGTAVFLGSLSPGNSPAAVSFGGNVDLVGGTALNMEIGGETAGTNYDQINVAGNLSVGGVLTVSLINGFTPVAGATFDLLNWGTLEGVFSSLQLPSLGSSLAWDTSDLYSSGELSVVAVGLGGDYNDDGAVDAADYVIWRKGGPLLNEVDVPGAINETDYDAWQTRFGTTAPGGGGSADGQVPEPGGLAMILLLAATILARRRGR